MTDPKMKKAEAEASLPTWAEIKKAYASPIVARGLQPGASEDDIDDASDSLINENLHDLFMDANIGSFDAADERVREKLPTTYSKDDPWYKSKVKQALAEASNKLSDVAGKYYDMKHSMDQTHKFPLGFNEGINSNGRLNEDQEEILGRIARGIRAIQQYKQDPALWNEVSTTASERNKYATLLEKLEGKDTINPEAPEKDKYDELAEKGAIDPNAPEDDPARSVDTVNHTTNFLDMLGKDKPVRVDPTRAARVAQMGGQLLRGDDGKYTDEGLENRYADYAARRDKFEGYTGDQKDEAALQALRKEIYDPDAKPAVNPISPTVQEGGATSDERQSTALNWMKNYLGIDVAPKEDKTFQVTPRTSSPLYQEAMLNSFEDRYAKELAELDDPEYWTEDRMNTVSKIPHTPTSDPALTDTDDMNIGHALGIRPTLRGKYLKNLLVDYAQKSPQPFKPWVTDKAGVPKYPNEYNFIADHPNPSRDELIDFVDTTYPEMNRWARSRQYNWLWGGYDSPPKDMKHYDPATHQVPEKEPAEKKPAAEKKAPAKKPAEKKPAEKPKKPVKNVVNDDLAKIGVELGKKPATKKSEERRIPTWAEIRKMAEEGCSDPADSYEDSADDLESGGKVLYPNKDNDIGEQQ